MSTPTDVDGATPRAATSGTPGGRARHAPDENDARTRRISSRARSIFLASVVVTLVPLVTATVRAIHNGWLPIGDNALFELRARDVFSHNFPFLGTWTSASQTSHCTVA